MNIFYFFSETDCNGIVEMDDFGHRFGVFADHSDDLIGVFFISELDFIHIVKTFPQITLHHLRTSRLGKHLKQFIVRQEIKSRKGLTFHF
jgi:hypothetical protein